ncbi:sulfatase-like hydrolase/transferase [soil metagenome]
MCRWPFLLMMLLAIMAEGNSTGAADAAGGDRPNIVLIMADDMGFECVGANGGETYKTPHLDQLAATGARFEHGYSQPICTPSRVQIMTGLYNSRNYIQFGLLDPKAFTFGNLLQDAGYATCVVGKWQLRGGFDGPHRFGFDEYCLWQLTRRPNRYPNPGLEINGEEIDFKNGEYGPDLVSDYACDFIERHSGGEKPFFLYYPMILPHWPFEPTPDSDDWDPTFRRADESEKNYGMRDQKHFIDMVQYTDKLVGKIVAKLDEQGVRDKTLVIFTCDNGTYESVTSRFRGRMWIGGKGHMMDNGTHVPLIANWPGTIREGHVSADLVDFSDVLPTVAEVAGVEIPATLKLDGRSFAPVFQGEPGARDWVYCWYYRNGKPERGGQDKTAGESARDHRYKLYLEGGFYDVPADFYEKSPLDPAKLNAEQHAVWNQLRAVIEQHTRQGFSDATEPKSGGPTP